MPVSRSRNPAQPMPLATSAHNPPRRRWPRRMVRIALLTLVLALILLAWPLGCTTRIKPPANVQDPAVIHIIDHGHTATLVVPTGEQPRGQETELRRYAYGDWRYYAQGQPGWFNGVRALAWPTQGALGRGVLSGPANEQTIRAQIPVSVDRIHRFYVERDAAAALVEHLDDLYHQQQHTLLRNPYVELDFVEHPRKYTYFYNSNHMVARWLQMMDVEVAGPAYTSRWRVIDPD